MLIGEFGEIAGYEIITQKYKLHFYMKQNTIQIHFKENTIKNKILFKFTLKKIKYLNI